MSIHFGHPVGTNVATMLLSLLLEEEANVVSAEEEVTRCQTKAERHRQKVAKLRQALQALGIDRGERTEL
jgi:hypothetical protein